MQIHSVEIDGIRVEFSMGEDGELRLRAVDRTTGVEVSTDSLDLATQLKLEDERAKAVELARTTRDEQQPQRPRGRPERLMRPGRPGRPDRHGNTQHHFPGGLHRPHHDRGMDRGFDR